MECSSCHDPHNTPGKVLDVYLLRGTLTGNDTNYICLKCHAK
jgi:predicted CXXCH cytochrome family protein